MGPQIFPPKLLPDFEMKLSPSSFLLLVTKQDKPGFLEADIFQVKSFALGTTSIRQQGNVNMPSGLKWVLILCCKIRHCMAGTATPSGGSISGKRRGLLTP